MRRVAQLLLLYAAGCVSIRLRPPQGLGITVCTTVQNELAYLPEWIEHYAAQGVSRVVLGDHRGTDHLARLPALYAGRSDVQVVVLRVSGAVRSITTQVRFLSSCARRFAAKADWVAFLDSDEFAWSPGHGTLRAYLGALSTEVTQVHAFDVFFGYSGCEERPRAWLRDGALHVDGGRNLNFLVQSHLHRAPSPLLGEGAAIEALRATEPGCNATAGRARFGAAFSGADFCNHMLAPRWGKSFVRSYAFGYLDNPHFAQLRAGLSHRELDLGQLRINHYWVRCRQDAYIKAEQWGKHDPVEWVELAPRLQSAVFDDGLARLRAVQGV